MVATKSLSIKSLPSKHLPTKSSSALTKAELSALYDRIYDIADRLFKKYNPCNIHIKRNKTKCMDKLVIYNHLCCKWYGDRCKHWKNGCTIKCLACKLFICGVVREDKLVPNFVKTLSKLRRIANKYGLSNFDYFMTKQEALKRVHRYYRR